MTAPEQSSTPLSRPLQAQRSGERPRDLSGRTLGDFAVERLLGHGGMGDVYLARQLSLDRPIALKVLKPELAADPIYMARFETEAWAAAKLNHPNIVHIYTLGAVDGIRFIAMEFVAGSNLREHLARRGPPDLPNALSIMREAALAVAAAAQAGLVHRDIKPENLLLTPDLHVKVADFGLCRRPDSESLHLTQPGMTLGTPMYMSPEQVQGMPLDQRSDLYSLGVTFYHLLAGFPPFRAETPVALALKHVHETPVNLSEHRPDLPPELCALVMKLLEKDPANRYRSASELLRDLGCIRQASGTPSATLILDDEPVSPGSASVAALPARVDPPSAVETQARHKWLRPRWQWALLLIPVSFLLGTSLGRMRRPAAEFTPAPPPTTLPGVLLEPWELLVPARPTAESQYRYAQTLAPASRRPAAWLAVPGRFPDDLEMAQLAYAQLIRDLLVRGDATRLGLLGEEFAAEHDRGNDPRWLSLARLARAAAAARRDDASAVLEQFRSWQNLELMDPVLAEVALEITMLASRTPSGQGTNRGPLAKLVSGLLEPLQLGGFPSREAIERLILSGN